MAVLSIEGMGLTLTEDGLDSSKEKVGSSRHFMLVVGTCLPVSLGLMGSVLLSFLSFCSFSSPLDDGSEVPLTLAVAGAVTYPELSDSSAVQLGVSSWGAAGISAFPVTIYYFFAGHIVSIYLLTL